MGKILGTVEGKAVGLEVVVGARVGGVDGITVGTDVVVGLALGIADEGTELGV